MTRRSPINLIKAAIGPAIALFVIAHFAGFAIFGQNGLLSLAGIVREKTDHGIALARLEAERARLAHHAALLDPHHVDPDLADEMVRRGTGQVRPDEVIIPRR